MYLADLVNPANAPAAVQWIIMAGAVGTAVTAIWRRILRPSAELVKHVSRIMPILVDIADQFEPDSGTSLRDVINRLESRLTAQSTLIKRLADAVEVNNGKHP